MKSPSNENNYSNILSIDVESNFRTEFIPRKELIGLLKISERTLQRLDARRKGPPRIRVGTKTMYYIPAVREWLLSCQETPHRKRTTK